MHHRTPPLKHVATVVLSLALAGAFLKAASDTKFNEQRASLYAKAKADQKQRGYSEDSEGHKRVFKDFPSPEIRLCKAVEVKPGEAVTIEVAGTFADGTAVLVDNDAVELASPTMGGGRAKATLNVSQDLGPGFVRLYFFTPVSGGYAACDVVFVNKVEAYSFTADNGWTVVVTPEGKAFDLEDGRARLAYRAEFYKPGERKPFETMTAVREIGQGSAPAADFSVSLREQPSGAMAEMEALQKKMSDPQAFMKLSQKEQDELMEKLTALSEQMVQEMTANTDMAAMQRKQDEFGCGSVAITRAAGDKATGTVNCGKNVGVLTLTGTAK